MNRSRAMPALIVLAALAAGCQNEDKSRSSSISGPLPPGLTVRLEYERHRDPPDPARGARFEATLAGGALAGATLRVPDGTDFPLVEHPRTDPRIAPLWSFEAIASEAEILRRFPNGAYAFDIVLADGTRRALTAFVFGSFADFPDVVVPERDALVPIDVRFRWTGPDTRYDVEVVNETTGESILVAGGLRGFEALPAVKLEPHSPYTLVLKAESGPSGGLYEFDSITKVPFVTGGE